MDNRQARTIGTFHQVLDYLTDHPITPEPPLLADARTSLIASIHRIDQLQRAQMTAERDMKGNVEHRRDALRRERMLPLKRIAARHLKFTAAEAALKVPHKREDSRTVADAALRMADALEPHPELLDAAALPSDFLAKMRREAHDLALTARRSVTARNRRSLATRDMAAEFRNADDDRGSRDAAPRHGS